jgi:hypothetical protein
MNLVVASRQDSRHMRFDVEGRWQSGDALKLAYMVKAAVTRLRQDHVLIDLRRVATPPESEANSSSVTGCAAPLPPRHA